MTDSTTFFFSVSLCRRLKLYSLYGKIGYFVSYRRVNAEKVKGGEGRGSGLLTVHTNENDVGRRVAY